MIDVGGNDHASARHFLAHDSGVTNSGMSGPKLSPSARRSLAPSSAGFARQILAMGDIDHFLLTIPRGRIELGDELAWATRRAACATPDRAAPDDRPRRRRCPRADRAPLGRGIASGGDPAFAHGGDRLRDRSARRFGIRSGRIIDLDRRPVRVASPISRKGNPDVGMAARARHRPCASHNWPGGDGAGAANFDELAISFMAVSTCVGRHGGGWATCEIRTGRSCPFAGMTGIMFKGFGLLPSLRRSGTPLEQDGRSGPHEAICQLRRGRRIAPERTPIIPYHIRRL